MISLGYLPSTQTTLQTNFWEIIKLTNSLSKLTKLLTKTVAYISYTDFPTFENWGLMSIASENYPDISLLTFFIGDSTLQTDWWQCSKVF